MCVLLVGVFFVPAAFTQAAPVTFVFDAQVTSTYETPSTDIGLPFDVSLGDTIHGRFTFEPAPLGQVGVQNLGIQFEIAGVTLHSPTYEIRIALNQLPPLQVPPIEGSSDPVLQIGGGPIEPVELGYFDAISVSCSFSSNGPQCDPGTVPGNDSIRWRPFISLSGESPLLSGDLTGDINVWNSFNGRSLELDFFTPGVGGVSVGALIGPFTAVPEPTSWHSLVSLVLIILMLRPAGYMRSYRRRAPAC